MTRACFTCSNWNPSTIRGRIKVGFAVSLPERLRTLRCSAPFTKVVQTWPCKVLWERTAIESVTDGCKQLHTEVFRTASIESVVQRCDQFFSLMPELQGRDGPHGITLDRSLEWPKRDKRDGHTKELGLGSDQPR